MAPESDLQRELSGANWKVRLFFGFIFGGLVGLGTVPFIADFQNAVTAVIACSVCFAGIGAVCGGKTLAFLINLFS